jgi:hypothetical protein
MTTIQTLAYMKNAIAPVTIDWASAAAYERPDAMTVRTSVAKATDGAAPNKPAKLFGLRTVPIAANAETQTPPIKNRVSDMPITGRCPYSHINTVRGSVQPTT